VRSRSFGFRVHELMDQIHELLDQTFAMVCAGRGHRPEIFLRSAASPCSVPSYSAGRVLSEAGGRR
jgi:hypothetical protein